MSSFDFARGHILTELWIARSAILRALGTTCAIAGSGILGGITIAAFASVAATFGPASLRRLIDLYVFVLRGIPLLVTMLFLFFGLGSVWKAISAEFTAVLALGLFAGAYLTEDFRGAMQSISMAHKEAAKALGLPFWSRIRFVIFPLSICRALPSAVNTAVEMSKATTLVSALGIVDLLLSGQQLAMRTLLIPEVYVTLWAVYLIINSGLTVLGRWLERRYSYVVY